VLWTTGPPFSAFVVAHRVAQRTGIPYVLDFRTSWTVVPSPFEAIRPAWAQQRDRRTLRKLLRDASAVTFFYESEAECFWRIYRDVLDVSRIHVIPNGFDGDVQAFAAPESSRFTILYTGTLSDYGFDGFLEGLSRFISRAPGRAQQVAVQFFGETDPQLMPRVRELHLGDVVSAQPPIPHASVGEVQRQAHALLMLERKPSHKGYELLAGAKLFGYLKAGKPILGCVPPGEAQRILRDVGATTVADASSASEVEHALEQMFSHWRAGTLSTLVPDRVACQRYSGRAQTEALVRALEGRPALHPFTPGVHDVAPSLRAEFAAAGWA
jgi:glycosyltransferase involved in cell wall biosynthesis